MYNYHQASGILDHDGVVLLHCYAGHGVGLNNPAMQDQHDVGPLPEGHYTMAAYDRFSAHRRVSRRSSLFPDTANQMFDRSGFRIHGDNAAANHTASDGCIIAGHIVERTGIWNSGGDRDLMVFA